MTALPFLPPVAQWVEAASHPAIMDTTRAKRELGWAPRFTALETLRDTLRPRPQPDSDRPVRIPLRTGAGSVMTTAFPGAATRRLINGVSRPHPVKGGR